MADGTAQGKSSRVNPLIIGGGVVIVVLVGVIVALVMNLNRGEPQNTREGMEQRAVVINEDNVDEVLQEVIEDPWVPPGYYEVTMNTTWHFPDGASPSSDAYVENVEGNTNDVYFDVQLHDTEEVIYESPVIPRGAHLDNITLNRVLDAGEYDCVVEYHLVDEQQKTLSTLNMAITVIVES
jgi:hypothetical protein